MVRRRGLGSLARRRPRSKVYGVGLLTWIGRGAGLSSAILSVVDIFLGGCLEGKEIRLGKLFGLELSASLFFENAVAKTAF